MAEGYEEPPSYESIPMEDIGKGRVGPQPPMGTKTGGAPVYISLIDGAADGQYASIPATDILGKESGIYTSLDLYDYVLPSTDIQKHQPTHGTPPPPPPPPPSCSQGQPQRNNDTSKKKRCICMAAFVVIGMIIGVGVGIGLREVFISGPEDDDPKRDTSPTGTTDVDPSSVTSSGGTTAVDHNSVTSSGGTTDGVVTPSVIHIDCSTNPCQNGARCTTAGARDFHCFCDHPYYGYQCEYTKISNTCDVKQGSTGMATPNYSSGQGYETHHCSKCPQSSCTNEIHIISQYEPEGGNRGFQQRPTVVPNLPITVEGSLSHKPLTLVLTSYEAANFVITLPEGVTVSKIYLLSYYVAESSVKVSDHTGQELNNNITIVKDRIYVKYHGLCETVNYGFGYNRNCKGIDEVLDITSHSECFTSFSGRYVVSSWRLNLDANSC